MVKTKLNNAALSAVADLFVEQGLIDGRALDPKNKHAARDVLKASLESYIGAITAGYHQVLEEVSTRWGTKRLPEFMMNEVETPPKEGAVPEPRYSDDSIKAVYELAVELKERRELDKAASIFVFLIYLDPQVAWFWEGLGQCWQEGNQWEAARFAFGTAVNCDPTDPEHYRSLCNCLLEMGERSKAQAVLEYGLEMLRKEPRNKQVAETREILDAMLAYVKSLDAKGRRL